MVLMLSCVQLSVVNYVETNQLPEPTDLSPPSFRIVGGPTTFIPAQTTVCVPKLLSSKIKETRHGWQRFVKVKTSVRVSTKLCNNLNRIFLFYLLSSPPSPVRLTPTLPSISACCQTSIPFVFWASVSGLNPYFLLTNSDLSYNK